MPPSNVQGLNEIDTTTSPKSHSDTRDLLNFPNYSDFNAQLDLWTTISFDSEDHLLRKGNSSHSNESKSPSGEGDDDETSSKDGDVLYPGDAHEHVVTGIPLPTQNTAPAPASESRQIQQPLDLAALLSSFGVNPLGIQLQQQLQQQLQLQPPAPAGPAIPVNMPALAQLLSLPPPTSPQSQPSIPTSPVSDAQSPLNKQTPSAPKRARVTKSPTDTAVANTPNEFNSMTPPSAAEDKRRRNTAASARFRLKKKEREAALEKRAKELEVKVSELEKECEGLRRENGWLKGLVVGVTGVAAPPQLPSLDVRAGVKRQREDNSAADR